MAGEVGLPTIESFSCPDGMRIEVAPYRRVFREPLVTSAGAWEAREGLLLRVTRPDGFVGYGEVAPAPFFPVETIPQAVEGLRKLAGREWDLTGLASTPCLRAGLSMALDPVESDVRVVSSAALLRAGEWVSDDIEVLRSKGFTTFKVKIGVADDEASEQAQIRELLANLRGEERLRLDANGSLDPARAEAWLQVLDESPHVDLLEQPLPPDSDFRDLLREWSATFRTRLALDESVVSAESAIELAEALPEAILVVKPALFGDWRKLVELASIAPGRLVFSTVFETTIGFGHLVRLAANLAPEMVHGLGGRDWFTDDLDSPTLGPVIPVPEKTTMEAIWTHFASR